MQGMTQWVRENFTQKKGFCTDDLHPSQLAHKELLVVQLLNHL